MTYVILGKSLGHRHRQRQRHVHDGGMVHVHENLMQR